MLCAIERALVVQNSELVSAFLSCEVDARSTVEVV